MQKKIENMCSTLDKCYDDAIAYRTSLNESVKIEEKHIKAVLASAKKIVCYLTILKKSATTKITHGELVACKDMHVFSDRTYLKTSVHDLNITYTPPDAKDECQTLISTPGDGTWAAAEYDQYTQQWLRATIVCSHKAPLAGQYSVWYRGHQRGGAVMTITCANQAKGYGFSAPEKIQFSGVGSKCKMPRDAAATMYIEHTHGRGKYECLYIDGSSVKGSHYLANGQYYGTVEYRVTSTNSCEA